MAISVNWATGVISVPRADMQLIQSTPTEIRQLDLDAFRLELKDLEDDPGEGATYTDTHRHIQPVSVGGVTLARVVEILEPYTVTFEDGQYQVNLVGANSNVADRTNLNQVGIRSANSAGLTFSEEINNQSYANAMVYLDTSDGRSGTQFPRGTPTDPVDNLADALRIANARGLHAISLRGFVTATVSTPIDGFEIIGGSGSNNGVILSGTTTAQSSFERLIVAGAQNGLARFRDCILGANGLGALTGAEGRIVDCIVNTAAGVTQRSDGVGCLFDNCSFVAPNDPQITIDANGKGFGLRKCTGNILVTNQTVVETLEVHIEGARIEFDASCTAGTVVVSGSGMVTDNSGVGCTIDAKGVADPVIPMETWQRFGLDPANPLTSTTTTITVDGITINLTGDGTTTSTATRQ